MNRSVGDVALADHQRPAGIRTSLGCILSTLQTSQGQAIAEYAKVATQIDLADASAFFLVHALATAVQSCDVF